MKYIPTIGLEVHVQLATQTKLFCACRNGFGAEPNRRTCPVCLGMPGTLPVLNEQAVRLALRAAVALECTVAPVSSFERKNYFYPDLPKNYQITQYATPLGSHGGLDTCPDGERLRVGIERLHLEEDAGKLIHAEEGHGEEGGYSMVDLNRCGVPLIEIVSKPELRSAEQAYDYLTRLKQILRYAGVSDCDMEKGQLRCDVNLSVRPEGSDRLGTRAEVKNLNSFRNVQRAIECEIARQSKILDANGIIVQETRLFDADRGVTEPMRSKEEAGDYRYFPEPDLGPLVLKEGWLARARAALPELPAVRRARFVKVHGLTDYAAEVLTARKEVADYFEACLAGGAQAKTAGNWVMGELLREVKDRGCDIGGLGVPPESLVELIGLVGDGTINANTGKSVLAAMIASGKSAQQVVAEEGLAQVSDDAPLLEAIARAIGKNPKAVADYRLGKKSAAGFLMGQVMRETGGKANPKRVGPLLEKAMKDPLEK